MTKLLIGANKTKYFVLEQLGKALAEFGIECKVVDAAKTFAVSSGSMPTIFHSDKKFQDIIQEFKPNAILTDYLGHFGLAALKNKIPLFSYLRGDIWSEFRWLRKTTHTSPRSKISLWLTQRMALKCLENSQTILTSSAHLKNIVSRHYPEKKIEFLYSCVDPACWHPDENLNLKHPCVGMIQDATVWEKTIEMLTLVNVMRALPDVAFYWAGDGPFKDYILPTLAKEPNFVWLGRLEHPGSIRKFLSTMDVYALVTGTDMLGYSNIEAQMMERPVVATNVGGVSETIQEQKTGFLVEKGDYKGWIEKLTILLHDKERAAQMGKAGRIFVMEEFSERKMASKLALIVSQMRT